MSAGIASLRQAVTGRTAAAADKLDPNFAYLRITRGGSSGLMWRGSIEKTAQGPVEVYYSGNGEVLRLRDGRLLGISGLPTEWRQVVDGSPSWSTVVTGKQPVTFTRLRDVLPGYRSGVRDELILGRVGPRERSALRGIDPHALTWFEERVRERGFRLPGAASDALPPARYALDLSGTQPTVVYSELCVAPDLCFTWQRWSAAMQQAVARAR